MDTVNKISQELATFSRLYGLRFWERKDSTYPKYEIEFVNPTSGEHAGYTIDNIEYSDEEFSKMIESLKQDILVRLLELQIVD